MGWANSLATPPRRIGLAATAMNGDFMLIANRPSDHRRSERTSPSAIGTLLLSYGQRDTAAMNTGVIVTDIDKKQAPNKPKQSHPQFSPSQYFFTCGLFKSCLFTRLLDELDQLLVEVGHIPLRRTACESILRHSIQEAAEHDRIPEWVMNKESETTKIHEQAESDKQATMDDARMVTTTTMPFSVSATLLSRLVATASVPLAPSSLETSAQSST